MRGRSLGENKISYQSESDENQKTHFEILAEGSGGV